MCINSSKTLERLCSLDLVKVNSSLSAVCRAHLQCSRCWKGSRGSFFGCSGTEPRPDSRHPPPSSSCGSPRGPWRKSCPCSRPGHITKGCGLVLIARCVHHLHFLLSYWPSTIFDGVKRGDELRSTQIWSSDHQHHPVEKRRTAQPLYTDLTVDVVEALLLDQYAVSVRHQARSSLQATLPRDTCVRPWDQFWFKE